MQDLVGIVRNEEEMLKAMEKIKILKRRAKKVKVVATGNTIGLAYGTGSEKFTNCF